MDHNTAEVPGLDQEQVQRVMLHLARGFDEPFTQEELFAKVDVIDEWYQSHIADAALWKLWREGSVEFSVNDDGEITVEAT